MTCEISNGVTLLLGGNGAGKSTLIATLSSGRRSRTGTWALTVDGAVLDDQQTRRATGLLPQSPAFPPRMTGAECVEYVAWLRRVPRVNRTAQVRAAMEFAHATHVADVAWGRMSYGTKQRVAIAAALVNRPSLVLLDEPLNGLDIAEKHSLIGVLGSLPWPAITVVSSHVVEGLKDVASDIIVLAQGSVAYAGPIAEFTGDERSLERAYLDVQRGD